MNRNGFIVFVQPVEKLDPILDVGIKNYKRINVGDNMSYDLKKIEENFHKYLRTGLDKKEFRIHEIKLTDELFKQQKAFYFPFGHVSYFLVIEEEKPVLYANVLSRMDLDLIVFVDENGYEVYDLWEDDNDADNWEKYFDCLDKVKRFNYDDLIFINDIEK